MTAQKRRFVIIRCLLFPTTVVLFPTALLGTVENVYKGSSKLRGRRLQQAWDLASQGTLLAADSRLLLSMSHFTFVLAQSLALRPALALTFVVFPGHVPVLVQNSLSLCHFLQSFLFATVELPEKRRQSGANHAPSPNIICIFVADGRLEEVASGPATAGEGLVEILVQIRRRRQTSVQHRVIATGGKLDKLEPATLLISSP